MKPAALSFFRFALPLALLLGSCGIEDYLFLYPVSPGNIRMELNSLSTIVLPNINISEYYYFSNFTLYYRIYLSDAQESGEIQPSQQSLQRVNPTLYNDYAVLEPLTNTESSVTTALASTFRGRNYHTLALRDENIETVLDRNSLGRTINLDFAQLPGTYPSLRVATDIAGVEDTYVLYRSNDNGAFSPRPDQYLVNTSDLRRSDYLTTNFNADVVGNSSLPAGVIRYAYMSVYIVVTGMDGNYSPVYSRPTHVGIFRLPEG
jgi:hypothetical protein